MRDVLLEPSHDGIVQQMRKSACVANGARAKYKSKRANENLKDEETEILRGAIKVVKQRNFPNFGAGMYFSVRIDAHIDSRVNQNF